jgi:hypothetical protein
VTARLKSEIWVQAFLRRCNIEGKFGAVLHRGNADAGAVMVVVNRLNGTHSLLGPAPGPAYDDDGERRFELLTPDPIDWPDTSDKIARARRFDDDLWVVEVEDREGLAGIVLAKP